MTSQGSPKMDDDNDNPACFPVLEMFRRLASAGSLAMKQEKDHMMALVQSSSAGDRLKMDNWNMKPFINNQTKQQNGDEEEAEIVFSREDNDTEHSGKENEDDDETLDTSSSCSSSSPSSHPCVEAQPETLSKEQQAVEQTPSSQQIKSKAPSKMKKAPKTPSVFGLDVVMESGLEELEDELEEEEESQQQQTDQESSSSVPRSVTIRWSDDDNNDDPRVTVHEVECFKDQTDMWWQGSEFVTIKQNVNETIRFCKAYNRNQVELLEDIMRCDCLEDEDLMKDLLQDLLSTCDSSRRSSSSESFTRGLEGHLSKLINKHRRRHAIKVLNAQEKLKTCDSEETYWERLREESLDKSQLLAAFARRMGQFDEMVVAKSLKPRKSLWDI